MHQDLVTDGDDGTWLLVTDGSRFSKGFSTRSAKITSANLGRTWSTHNLMNLWIPDIGGLYYLICTVWGVIGVVTEHVSLTLQGDGMNWAPQNALLTLTSQSLKVPNLSDYELILSMFVHIKNWLTGKSAGNCYIWWYILWFKKSIRNPYAPRNADAWILAYSQLRICHVGTFPEDW